MILMKIPLTILLQNIFFTLYDSSVRITLFLGTSGIVLLGCGIFLVVFCNSYNPAKERLRNNILYCSIVSVLLLWSLWTLVSALISSATVTLGLPLLWFTYLISSLCGTGSGVLLLLSFSRRLAAFTNPTTIGAPNKTPSEIDSRVLSALKIADFVFGGWTLVYTVLYSIGVLSI